MPARTGAAVSGRTARRQGGVGRRSSASRDVVVAPGVHRRRARTRRGVRSAAQHADRCLMPDPETGEPINVSHMIPRSRDDLRKRHDCLAAIAEYSVGLMGRTPDYMNVTYAGFRRARRGVGDQRQRGRRGAARRVSEEAAPRRHFADAHHHPADDRQGAGRRAAGRQHGLAAQGRQDRERHRRIGRARAVDARAVRRRTRGLPRRAVAATARTTSRCRSAFRCLRRA